MSKILIFTGITIGGWIGWWLGSFVGLGTAVVVSTLFSVAGVYAGSRLADHFSE